MLELIPAGKYLARPADWGISETKAGDPQVFVKFEFGGKSLTWFGSLKEGRAQEITIDSLLALGFRSNDLSELNKETTILDTTKDVQIVVEHEEYNGKISAKIKWVNPLSVGVKRMDAKKTKSLKSLSGAVLARRKETGIEIPTVDDLEDMPF